MASWSADKVFAYGREKATINRYRERIKGRERIGDLLEVADLHRTLGIALAESGEGRRAVRHFLFGLVVRLYREKRRVWISTG